MLNKRIFKILISLFTLVFLSTSASAATISYNGTFNGDNGVAFCSQNGFIADNYGPIQVNTTSQVTINILNYGGAVDMGVYFFEPSSPSVVVGGFPAGVAYDTGTGTVTVTLTAGVDYMLEVCELAFAPTGASYSVEIVGDFVSNASTSQASTDIVISSVAYAPDERINWQYGDLHAVLYRSSNSEGNPAIDVYCWDGSNSWLGLRVDASTASGTSANGCDTTFYIGSDGIYQFNINFDGKLYEIRCEDFVCRPPEKLYYDPNE